MAVSRILKNTEAKIVFMDLERHLYTKYTEWRHKYPEAMRWMTNRAFYMKDVEKREHYAVGAMLQAFRHHTTKVAGTTFKINNNHGAFIAREIMYLNPVMRDFFNVRGSLYISFFDRIKKFEQMDLPT